MPNTKTNQQPNNSVSLQTQQLVSHGIRTQEMIPTNNHCDRRSNWQQAASLCSQTLHGHPWKDHGINRGPLFFVISCTTNNCCGHIVHRLNDVVPKIISFFILHPEALKQLMGGKGQVSKKSSESHPNAQLALLMFVFLHA